MKKRKHLQSSFHRQTRAQPEQFFQRGDGLVSLYHFLKRRYTKPKSPERQLNEYLSTVQGYFPGESASALAAAMLAKKGLDSTKQVSDPFPEEYFDGTAAIDDEALVRLASYARELQKLRTDMIKFNSPFSLAVAKGLTTWIASLHALSRPDLLPKGQEIWSRLLRGESRIEEAYCMLLRRKLDDVEKGFLTYRPSIFLSENGKAELVRNLDI